MNVNLYQCISDDRAVSKSLNLIATASFDIKGDVSISNPDIILEGFNTNSLKNINYMFIPQWGRYYFITNITVMTGNRVRISGRVDVLMSNKNAILSTTCVVERNEYEYSPELVDDSWTIEATRLYTYHNIYTIPTDGYYYMTVV